VVTGSELSVLHSYSTALSFAWSVLVGLGVITVLRSVGLRTDSTIITESLLRLVISCWEGGVSLTSRSSCSLALEAGLIDRSLSLGASSFTLSTDTFLALTSSLGLAADRLACTDTRHYLMTCTHVLIMYLGQYSVPWIDSTNCVQAGRLWFLVFLAMWVWMFNQD